MKKKIIELKERYNNLSELKKDADDGGFFMVSMPESKYIRMESPIEEHMIRENPFVQYKIEEDGSLIQYHIEHKHKELAQLLAKCINPERLMLHVLSNINPAEIEELYERAVEKEGKTSEAPGCYSINVGGKRGRPFNFVVVP